MARWCRSWIKKREQPRVKSWRSSVSVVCGRAWDRESLWSVPWPPRNGLSMTLSRFGYACPVHHHLRCQNLSRRSTAWHKHNVIGTYIIANRIISLDYRLEKEKRIKQLQFLILYIVERYVLFYFGIFILHYTTASTQGNTATRLEKTIVSYK